jgi:protein-S-isoprenylcysteine O-methyltransferase Ste14
VTPKQTLSLLLRNLFYAIVQPGLVVVFIPWFLLHYGDYEPVSLPLSFWRYAGLAVFCLGAVVLLDCILRFALQGGGTLSPIDPTKKLVTAGFYRYSRNPMYLAVIAMLAGEAIFFHSGMLWAYLAVMFVLFNTFIHLVEEPRLRREFGEAYAEYCDKVGRWV